MFPIKLTIIGGEGEADTVKFIVKKDWRLSYPEPREKVLSGQDKREGVVPMFTFLLTTPASLFIITL